MLAFATLKAKIRDNARLGFWLGVFFALGLLVVLGLPALLGGVIRARLEASVASLDQQWRAAGYGRVSLASYEQGWFGSSAHLLWHRGDAKYGAGHTLPLTLVHGPWCRGEDAGWDKGLGGEARHWGACWVALKLDVSNDDWVAMARSQGLAMAWTVEGLDAMAHVRARMGLDGSGTWSLDVPALSLSSAGTGQRVELQSLHWQGQLHQQGDAGAVVGDLHGQLQSLRWSGKQGGLRLSDLGLEVSFGPQSGLVSKARLWLGAGQWRGQRAQGLEALWAQQLDQKDGMQLALDLKLADFGTKGRWQSRWVLEGVDFLSWRSSLGYMAQRLVQGEEPAAAALEAGSMLFSRSVVHKPRFFSPGSQLSFDGADGRLAWDLRLARMDWGAFFENPTHLLTMMKGDVNLRLSKLLPGRLQQWWLRVSSDGARIVDRDNGARQNGAVVSRHWSDVLDQAVADGFLEADAMEYRADLRLRPGQDALLNGHAVFFVFD